MRSFRPTCSKRNFGRRWPARGPGGDADWLCWLTWVLPDRPLSREITRVMTAGYVRGADLWHLACALYLAGTPRDLAFLSLDEKQTAVSRQLGFAG